MQEQREEPFHCAVNAICDLLRYAGDVSYAVLPRDVAHELADLKKAFWGNVRTLVDKELEWIDARVAGGDRLREQWKNGCRPTDSDDVPHPVS